MKNGNIFNFTIDEVSGIPAYRQFKEQIKTAIRRNNLPAGTRLPDIRTLAEAAGIGVKTAYKGICELIDERVCFKRPKKGTFVGGGNEAANRRKKICCIHHKAPFTDIMNGDLVVATIYRGIVERATAMNLDIFLITGNAENSLDFYLDNATIEVAGVIMLQGDSYDELIRLAQIFPQVKLIYLNEFSENFETAPHNVFGVFNDDFGGGFQAADYLVQSGHRQLAALTLDIAGDNYRRRIKGFKAGLTGNGYCLATQFAELSCPFIGHHQNDDLVRAGFRLAEAAFAGTVKPTALFTVNDFLAMGALNFLKSRKWENQVELFGYDNLASSLSSENYFSTVAVDFYRMGEKAIDLLTGETEYLSRTIILNPQLLVRKHPEHPLPSKSATAGN